MYISCNYITNDYIYNKIFIYNWKQANVKPCLANKCETKHEIKT